MSLLNLLNLKTESLNDCDDILQTSVINGCQAKRKKSSDVKHKNVMDHTPPVMDYPHSKLSLSSEHVWLRGYDVMICVYLCKHRRLQTL